MSWYEVREGAWEKGPLWTRGPYALPMSRSTGTYTLRGRGWTTACSTDTDSRRSLQTVGHTARVCLSLVSEGGRDDPRVRAVCSQELASMHGAGSIVLPVTNF